MIMHVINMSLKIWLKYCKQIVIVTFQKRNIFVNKNNDNCRILMLISHEPFHSHLKKKQFKSGFLKSLYKAHAKLVSWL